MARADAEVSAASQRRAYRVWLPVAVALVLLGCYWPTLAPTVGPVDGGEIVTAVHTMGVPHPTGYPLWLIVGKLFDLLPLGEPARRIAVLSAVSAAGAGGLICWMLMSLTGSGAAGLLGGLAAGLNWWVWLQANQAEVYALNLLLVSVVLTMFVRWLEQPTVRRFNQLAFFSGLALAHHRTSLFFAAPALLWALLKTRPVSARLLARTAGFAVLPLLLYLWLPWRSMHNPPINWGNTSGSLQYFIEHVSGSLFYKIAFHESPAHAWSEAKLTFARMWQQFTPVGLGLMLVGLVALVRSRRHRALGVCLSVSFLVVFVWASFYDVPDKEVFYLPGMVAVALWCGAGLASAIRAAPALKLGAFVARLVPVAAALVALGLPLSMAQGTFPLVDRSRQYEVLEAGCALVAGVPANAVALFSDDESYGTAQYVYRCYDPRRRPIPMLLNSNHVLWAECEPLPDPRFRAVVLRASSLDAQRAPRELAWGLREVIDPERPFYTNVPLSEVPPGYVLLKDSPISRVVRPPGMPLAADPPDARALLKLGGASILGVTVPARVKRGDPFLITARVRWAGTGKPEGRLGLWFAHSAVAQQVARRQMRPEFRSLAGLRMIRVLFSAAIPASSPGHHYEQTAYVLLPRRMEAGPYQVFAQPLQGRQRDAPLVAVRSMLVH